MTIPNLITIGRLILVPVVILMILQERWLTAFLVFAVAGLSDGLDGILARRFGWQSELGASLDPVADKALLVGSYVTLAMVGALPVWLALIVVARDVLIVAAVLLAWGQGRPFEIRPIAISKANTAAQIGFAALVLAAEAFRWNLGNGGTLLALLVAALTVATAGAYLGAWLRRMTG